MKKYMILTAAVWLISILFLLISSPGTDRRFMTEINRLHETLTQNLLQGQEAAPAGTDTIPDITIINNKKAASDQSYIFFTGTDLKEDRFTILPVENTDYFIRYSFQTTESGKILWSILFSIAPVITLLVLIRLEREVMKPLREMSAIPGQLARGHYIFAAEQSQNKILHPFLWGLDMLRVKLEDQKDVNLRLEKERKTLVASLTHDIRTPLSSIISYGTAIRDDTCDSPDGVKEALDIMLAKAEKIRGLTDELLASSVNAIEEITVHVTEHYFSELRQAMDKAVRSRIALLQINYQMGQTDQNPILPVDLDRFIEVCDNITENAVKYGDLGSLNISFDNEEEHILISFENTGSTISETELKHVFSSFYRGSNVGEIKGHGLGLYIVKKIMTAMEGDAYAENTDTGVRIVLVLKQI